MNVKVAVQILELALALFQMVSTGVSQSDASVSQALKDIFRMAAQAYQDHLGQPIDPSLIKPEATT
jgi:hypothetical protein